MKAPVVIPCDNEAHRLSLIGFDEFRQHPHVRLIFVDDGATDDTRAVLERLCERMEGQARVLVQPRNGGKAEAVRAGLLAAYAAGDELLGYLDADLATPPGEMCRLLATLQERNVAVVIRVDHRGLRGSAAADLEGHRQVQAEAPGHPDDGGGSAEDLPAVAGAQAQPAARAPPVRPVE